MNNDERDLELLKQADGGNEASWSELLDAYRDRLKRLVRLRMDRRLQARLDASDVLQDTFLEAAGRLGDYLKDPDKMPFGLWLRFLTGQKILQLHRKHLGVKARDANREISLHNGPMPQATSVALAERLIGQLTSPSQGAIKAEMRLRLEETLTEMDEVDREIIALRHFEQLSLAEAAVVLDIKHTAACNRYVRALGRLKDLLAEANTM